MGLGKLLQQGAEDGELGLEGLGLVGPDDIAMAGVLRGSEAAAIEGGEADSFSRHFSIYLCVFAYWCGLFLSSKFDRVISVAIVRAMSDLM